MTYFGTYCRWIKNLAYFTQGCGFLKFLIIFAVNAFAILIKRLTLVLIVDGLKTKLIYSRMWFTNLVNFIILC